MAFLVMQVSGHMSPPQRVTTLSVPSSCCSSTCNTVTVLSWTSASGSLLHTQQAPSLVLKKCVLDEYVTPGRKRGRGTLGDRWTWRA